VTWTAPISDLRVLLSDGPTDKHRYRKKVFGEVNGTNTMFKTFEFRRVTDFTSAASPLGVWVNGVLLGAGGVASDNLPTGDFILAIAPTARQSVEASYYIQWFTDTELDGFLRLACNWMDFGDNYSTIGTSLRPAMLKYAAAEAYQKLSLRWAEHLSEVFLLNDAPKDKQMTPVQQYRQMSLDLRKEAQQVRDDYYLGSGQQLQVLFGTAGGNPTDPQPVR
jgi:hypothetical protein